VLPDALWVSGEHAPSVSGCFPSAHATTGYALFGWYFLARRARRRHSWRYALPGLVIGSVFGATQQLRGAHFVSHDLAAAGLCWALAWLVARVLFDTRAALGVAFSRS
jgi:membrane-associated PAP2 superfamily phosphatase